MSSNETFSPQRKSPREGTFCGGAGRADAVAVGAKDLGWLDCRGGHLPFTPRAFRVQGDQPTQGCVMLGSGLAGCRKPPASRCTLAAKRWKLIPRQPVSQTSDNALRRYLHRESVHDALPGGLCAFCPPAAPDLRDGQVHGAAGIATDAGGVCDDELAAWVCHFLITNPSSWRRFPLWGPR